MLEIHNATDRKVRKTKIGGNRVQHFDAKYRLFDEIFKSYSYRGGGYV